MSSTLRVAKHDRIEFKYRGLKYEIPWNECHRIHWIDNHGNNQSVKFGARNLEAITIRPIAIEIEGNKFIHVDKFNRVYRPDYYPFTNELMLIIGEDSDSE